MTVRIELLCQLDCLTNMTKMTGMTIWVSAGFAGRRRPDQLVGGQISALSFPGFKGRRLSTACEPTLHHASRPLPPLLANTSST